MPSRAPSWPSASRWAQPQPPQPAVTWGQTGPMRRGRLRPSKVVSPTDQKAARRPPSPKEVKALGRKVKNFDDETWLRERTRIVLEGSLHKFRQNPELRRELFGTGERELVEASPLDRVWGIGMGEKKGRETCASEASGRQGWGLNLLGKALVQARTILREEFKDEVEGKEQNADQVSNSIREWEKEFEDEDQIETFTISSPSFSQENHPNSSEATDLEDDVEDSLPLIVLVVR